MNLCLIPRDVDYRENLTFHRGTVAETSHNCFSCLFFCMHWSTYMATNNHRSWHC